VSCSQDRNAYVWEASDVAYEWKPTLVILRINRAATQVKWSPNGDKFAVASGANSVSVCYFEQDNNWWVSKHLRKNIESTVLSVDWHPNNILIACGGTDSKVFVVSGWVKGIDAKPGATPFGSRLPFGELLGEYVVGSWVHSVRWSPSGNQIAWASHDAAITVLDVTGGAPGYIQELKLAGLPFIDLAWVSEQSIVAVGHSCNPTLFSLGADGVWSQTREIDAAVAASSSGPASRAAFSVFQNKTTIGQDTKIETLNTKHQNAISQVTLLDARNVSTSGLDGRLIVWTI
jgi:actin related protein 2/3 complex subunit 1A/1B